jgi:hypothetical protein
MNSPRMGKTEGKHQKAGVRETLRGMKGCARPLFPKARNRFGLFLRTNFCRTSEEVPVSGLMTPGSVDAGVPPFALIRLRGRQVGQSARASAILKRRQPFTRVMRPEDPKRRQKERQAT